MKKILFSVACLMIVFLLTACNKNATIKNANDTLVSFTDSTLNITTGDLYDALKEKYGINYLIEMVDTIILDKKYPDDDISRKYISEEMEKYLTYYGNQEKLLTELQNYGYASISDFEEYLLLNYKRDLVTKDYVKTLITDKEINKYYDTSIIGDITASHILITVNVTDSMTDGEKREVEEKAQETIAEIYKKLDDGSKFEDLAKEYSKDTATSSNGGKLGTFNQGEMEESFEKAANLLKVGEYTKSAVRTKYGYHIIYKEAEKDKPKLSIVKDTIIDKIVTNKISSDSKLQYKALIDMRKELGFTLNDEDLNTYYDNAVNNWLYGE